MSNNANRLQKLTEIAGILDTCDDEEALAILSSYATLRGLQIGERRGTTSIVREESQSRSRSRRSNKGKQPVRTGSNKATSREARERELNMTTGQVLDAMSRLLNIQKEFKGKAGPEAVQIANKYGLNPDTARQEVGRAVQLCQDLTTWLNGKAWLNRATGQKVNTMPELSDSFRRLMGDEGSSSGSNSQDEVAENPS